MSSDTTSVPDSKRCIWYSNGAQVYLSTAVATFCGSASVIWVLPPDHKLRIYNASSLTFLQRVSIACYAERCISCDRFCLTDHPTVWPSVTRWYHAKTTPATIMRSSLEDSPMTLVSWRLTSARNSKGNIGSEGAEWERGSKNVAKMGNF